MCTWMVYANIPRFKLQIPEFQFFLETYCKHILEQSILRKHYLPICYEETFENVRRNIADALYGLLWTKQRIPWVALSRTLRLAS
jgi:hypothetical protein